MTQVPIPTARLAQTLQQLRSPDAAEGAPWRPEPPPGLGPADARIPLRQLIHRWQEAAGRRTDAARACLAEVPTPEACPDLWQGTVLDQVARGFRVRLEEALAHCKPAAPDPAWGAAVDAENHPGAKVFQGKALVRQREYVVISASSRVRITRKHGIHYLHRAKGIDIPRLLSFDWRADPEGSLDGFVGVDGAAPRRFETSSLPATRYIQAPGITIAEFTGRLGRGPIGFPVRMTWLGCGDVPGIRLRVEVDNQHVDHRLRLLWQTLADTTEVHHACTPVWAFVAHGGRRFAACTLVRATGALPLPGDTSTEVPDAQCRETVVHDFLLGGSGCG